MRGEDKPLVVIPFLLSLSLYCGIVYGIFYYLNYNEELIKKYSSKKDNFLEVAIVQNNEKIIKPKQVQKKDEKKIEKKIDKKQQKENKQEVKKTSKKTHLGIKNLFGKIKTKDINLSKTIPSSKSSTAIASRKKPKKTKSKKAKNLASSLNLSSSPSLPASSSVGEYDKFRGEVTEMLEGFWHQTPGTQIGAEANVKVLIDKDGHFSYDIVNFSYNSDFNAKLRDFLEDMQSVKFPKNVDNIPPLTVKFKDDME